MGRDYFRLARTFPFFSFLPTRANPRGHLAALLRSEETFREIFLSQSVARFEVDQLSRETPSREIIGNARKVVNPLVDRAPRTSSKLLDHFLSSCDWLRYSAE